MALDCKWEIMLLKAQRTDAESQIHEIERDFYPRLLQGQEEDRSTYVAVSKSVTTAVVAEEVEAKSSPPTITLTMKPTLKKEKHLPLLPPLHPPGLPQIQIQT